MDLNNRIEATLAFVFNKDFSKVLLIKKQKPIQHAGLLNGLGGKLEMGESHIECLTREIEEEAGIKTTNKDWTSVGKMSWSNWKVSIWTLVCEDNQTHFPEEDVSWQPVSPLPKNIIENLKWLIPLSVDINEKILKKEHTLPLVDIKYH